MPTQLMRCIVELVAFHTVKIALTGESMERKILVILATQLASNLKKKNLKKLTAIALMQMKNRVLEIFRKCLFWRVQSNITLLVLCGIFSAERILRNYKIILESMPRNSGIFIAIQ
uniref:Uncharacterized protein n=1 Tax=Arundo donax TaxID=35708 RepID=A0A0A9DAE2_ARUDO